MAVAFSINGIPIRLTEERLAHIAKQHPELAGGKDSILTVINDPDIVQKGDAGALIAVKHFEETPVKSNKYLNVVYKEQEVSGFVLTAYYSNSLRSRVILWKKS